MTSSPPTVDVHAHVLHETILDLSRDKVVLTGFGTVPAEERAKGSPREKTFEMMLKPDAHLAEMDRRAVDVHVLAASTVIQGTFWASAEEDARLCRLMNDRMAEWVASAPDRFVGTMVLPFQDLALTMAELERCRASLGLTIVNAPASAKGVYLGQPRFHDFWRQVEALGLVVIVHPDGVQDLWFQQYSLWNSIGQPIEETKFISSLIYEGTLDRFPDAKIIVSHGGGYLPLFMGRLNRNVTNKPFTTVNIKGMPSDYLRRLYFDTCVYDPVTLARLIETVGYDRVLLGSDFPVGDVDPYVLTNQLTGLSDKERAAINGGTASTLLGLGRQAASLERAHAAG